MLSLLKNFVLVSDEPSCALKSAVTVTGPVAVVGLAGVKSIYVPSVVVTLVTPAFVAGTLVQAVPS